MHLIYGTQSFLATATYVNYTANPFKGKFTSLQVIQDAYELVSSGQIWRNVGWGVGHATQQITMI